MNEKPARETTAGKESANRVARSAHPARRRRLAAVLGLFFLSPWVGEYLLGNLSVRLLPALPFLAPMYGGGAILVREFARRTGRGWPTILVLGAAYGIAEAGLVDQSLFNPSFSGLEYLDAPPTPVFGFSVYYLIAFVVGHAAWSIGVPIAIVELLSSPAVARTTPWLGRTGLAVTGLVYLGGCLLIFSDVRTTEDYLASPLQIAGAGAATVGLVVVAFVVPSRSVLPAVTPGRWGEVPAPKALAVISFGFASAFFAKPENWAGVILAVFLVCLGAS
nr:hypothetical protein [Micromonospora sp. DSM 115978]